METVILPGLHVEHDILTPEMRAFVESTLALPREPTVAEVRDEWSQLYNQQTDVLEAVTNALEAQTAIVDEARRFMTILAQRTHSGAPLFLINDLAGPGEADTLRHAILSLQAMLAGTEVPPCVQIDRVVH